MGILSKAIAMNATILVLALTVVAFVQGSSVLKTVKQCDGYENAPFQFISGTSPDQIPIPGEITMDMHSKITADMPADLVLKMDLQKQEPFPLDVPCLNGLGSCEYDLCQIIVDNGDTFCPGFPEGQACGCPLLANDYDMTGITIQVPDFGILNDLMVGTYKAKQFLYGKSDPENKLGCMEFEYEFIKG